MLVAARSCVAAVSHIESTVAAAFGRFCSVIDLDVGER